MAHPVDHLNAVGGNNGKVVNRLSFWITITVKAIVLKIAWSRYQHDYDGLRVSVSSIKEAMLEKEKTLYTISPSLFPRPDYWPAQAKVVGYYERDKTANWTPGEELIKFLERHEKIVFITFGSMSNSNPKEKTRLIVDVLKRNKISAIINTSWGGLEETNEQVDTIHFVNNVPYDWIFPKMYAIVHHGGSGTTHTALKNACPCLVVPHILDQFYWSRALSSLQVGPEGISIKNLDEKKFEWKLLDLMNNQTYKDNATVISEKMKAESDLRDLYAMIEHEGSEKKR